MTNIYEICENRVSKEVELFCGTAGCLIRSVNFDREYLGRDKPYTYNVENQRFPKCYECGNTLSESPLLRNLQHFE